MVSRIPLLVLAHVALGALLCAGCDTDCGCGSQYEKCLAESPPGAAKADCARQQDTCEAQCDASKSLEEQEHGLR
ncbi:MAG: hypothetical protein WKG00_30910 [Polyangiaceae bacterium]